MAYTKDPKYCYLFARYVMGAKIDVLVDSIIESNNAEYIYLTIRDIKKANKVKLINALLLTKNYEYILKTIEEVRNIDYRLFEKVILDSNNKTIIKRYLDIVKTTSNSKFDSYAINFSKDEILRYIQNNIVDDIDVFFDKLFDEEDPKNISLTIMKIINSPGKINIYDLVEYLYNSKYQDYLYLITSKIPYITLESIFNTKDFKKNNYIETDYIRLSKEDDCLPLISTFIEKLKSSGVPNKYIDSLIKKFYLEENQSFITPIKVKGKDKRKKHNTNE